MVFMVLSTSETRCEIASQSETTIYVSVCMLQQHFDTLAGFNIII